jgi:hypothetical protein
MWSASSRIAAAPDHLQGRDQQTGPTTILLLAAWTLALAITTGQPNRAGAYGVRSTASGRPRIASAISRPQ